MGTKIRNNFGHNLEDIIVLSFYFLDGVFWNSFLILMMSNFSIFFLLLLALLMLYLRNHCLIHGHNDLCLKPILRFLIHFGLILHITYSTILTSFFGMWLSSCLRTNFLKNFSFSTEWSLHHHQNQLIINVKAYSELSVLFHCFMSLFIPVQHCLFFYECEPQKFRKN